MCYVFFFSSRRRHTRFDCDWSSDVCSSDLLRRELFAHLQTLSLSFHNQSRSGDLLTKIAGDTNTLKDIFADSMLKFTTYVLTVAGMFAVRSEEHTSELQSQSNLVCRLLLEN